LNISTSLSDFDETIRHAHSVTRSRLGIDLRNQLFLPVAVSAVTG
jgi:hypothetical protein